MKLCLTNNSEDKDNGNIELAPSEISKFNSTKNDKIELVAGKFNSTEVVLFLLIEDSIANITQFYTYSYVIMLYIVNFVRILLFSFKKHPFLLL